MPLDLLGPGDAGAPYFVTTPPSGDVTNAYASDTYHTNCIGTASPGTPLMARALNRWLQQIRRVIRLAGIPLVSNADDDMLGKAIQSQALNWSTFGGTANALTATLSPAPGALIAGLEVSGLIASSNTNATTLNVNGLGATACLRADGVAFAGGELVAGGLAKLKFNGTQFNLISMLPVAFLNTANIGRLLNTQIITTTQTYTPTAGTARCIYDLLGGGGGGAGAVATTSGQCAIGGSGNGGARTVGSCLVGAISGQTVTIGAAGAAGAAGGAGGNGGQTSIGAVATAPGGLGGAAGTASTAVIQTPTRGSLGTGGNILAITGNLAQVGQGAMTTPSFFFAGAGGGSYYGDGGGSRQGNNAGQAADGYGAGGSGACVGPSASALAGGAGTQGIVVIQEFA